MTNVTFLPWRGAKYLAGFDGLRTLVLGESHYQKAGMGNIEKNPEITREIIQDQISGDDPPYAFWTRIAMAFLDRKPSLADKDTFWNSVAFYNYVQESAGDSARVCPTDSSLAASEPAFIQVLESLNPEFILVLGYRLWYKKPHLAGEFGSPISTAPKIKETWIYPTTHGSALAYCVKHPSSGFNAHEWHPHIVAAMNLAKARR